MTNKNILFYNLACILVFGLPSLVLAEKSHDFGDYIVHYNAFTTDILQAKIAKLYGIRRSKNRGLINISVQKKIMGTVGKPIRADVTGTASTLTGQMKHIKLREITDDTAIYYIGAFTVAHRETLNFSLQIKIEGEKSPFNVKFRQQFFAR